MDCNHFYWQSNFCIVASVHKQNKVSISVQLWIKEIRRLVISAVSLRQQKTNASAFVLIQRPTDTRADRPSLVCVKPATTNRHSGPSLAYYYWPTFSQSAHYVCSLRRADTGWLPLHAWLCETVSNYVNLKINRCGSSVRRHWLSKRKLSSERTADLYLKNNNNWIHSNPPSPNGTLPRL